MSIKNEARKDARKFARAKMEYGKGAGIKRRHIKAELSKKFDDEQYKQAFDAELEKIDFEKLVRNVKIKNGSKNSILKAKKVVKGIAKTGTVAASGYMAYVANKDKIKRAINNLKIYFKNKRNQKKYKEQSKIVNIEDARKAEAYLRSVGIDYTYKD